MNQKTVPEGYFEIHEVARQNPALTEPAIRARIQRGTFPFVRLGRRVLIPAAELEKFLSKLPGLTAEQALANVAKRMSRAVAK